MSQQKKKSFDLALLKRIYSLAAPYKLLFMGTVLSTLILAGLAPLRAWITQLTIDEYIVPRDLDGLFQMTILMMILLVFQSFIQFGQAYAAGYIGQNIIQSMRLKVFNHIQRYRSSKLDQTAVGTLVTRNISDLETVAEVFNEGLISIVGDLLQIVIIVSLMFFTHWKLTLVSLSVLPLLLYAGYLFKNAVKASFIQTRNEVTKLNTFVQEHIQGMQIVQIFNRGNQEYKKFDAINGSHRDAQNKGVFAYAVFFPVVEIITAIITALIVWYGVGQVISIPPTITLGILTSFLMWINLFFRPVRQLADRFNTLQMGMVAAERVFQLIDENEVIESSGNISHDIKGKVSFENVYFSYRDDTPVLKGISFKVEAGKTTALVGPTGAGKSSIINLVNHFYRIHSGSIYIDDIPLQDFDLENLRKQIATVQQDVFLFTGSILDNLNLFDKTIPMEKIKDAAKRVGIHQFIESLPDGYDTYVHERGSTLSSGQRQLIAFARALITDPKILILDEATSSVDSEAEELIQNAITELMKNRTCIIIAHRLSTIQHADEILVLENGNIVERGTHKDLMLLNGLYKRMYELQ